MEENLFFCTLEVCRSLDGLLYVVCKYGPLHKGSMTAGVEFVQNWTHTHIHPNKWRKTGGLYQCHHLHPGSATILVLQNIAIGEKMGKQAPHQISPYYLLKSTCEYAIISINDLMKKDTHSDLLPDIFTLLWPLPLGCEQDPMTCF